MNATSLEERVQRLEDEDAIGTLMAKYADYINKGWNGKVVDADRMPEIFTDDAKWDSPDMGLSGIGVDAIMAGLRAETAGIEFSMHAFLNPMVEVDGDGAASRCCCMLGPQ
jgi:hypothetical protein